LLISLFPENNGPATAEWQVVLFVFALSSSDAHAIVLQAHALSQSCADASIIGPTDDGTCSQNDINTVRKRHRQAGNDKTVIYARQNVILAIAKP